MQVSFVAPKLGRVLYDQANNTYFRVIEERSKYLVLYELPDIEGILELCHVSQAQYDELCERYDKWQSGDESITPVFANGQIAGGSQAKKPDDPAPRYMVSDQAPNTKPDKTRLPRSKRAKAAVLAKAQKAVKTGPTSWQVRDDRALLAAYNSLEGRYVLLWEDWDLYDVYSNKDSDASLELTLEELTECEDPVAPLLRSAQNEAEATKIAALAPLVADLDLVALRNANAQMNGNYFYRIALNFKVPTGFARHLLHIWCIFGGTPEGLMYTKELLAIQRCPNNFGFLPDELRLLFFPSVEHWAQDFFWTNLFDLMARKFLWNYPHAGLVWDGRLTQEIMYTIWDQAIYDDFGAAIIEAFGGPKHSLLWQFKHTPRFAPDNFASDYVRTVMEALMRKRTDHRGCLLAAQDMDRFGINPFYVHCLMPLPRKPGFVFDKTTRLLMLAEVDFYGMGNVLEYAAHALDKGFYPEAIEILTPPEQGCATDLDANLTGLSRVNKRQAPLKQLVVAALLLVQEKNDDRLSGALVFTLTEPDLESVKLLVARGVARIVYGVADPKHGAFSTGAFAQLGIELEVSAGIRAQECQHLIDLYYKAQRQKIARAQRKKPVTTAQANAELAAFARKVEQEYAAKQAASEQATETKSAAKKTAGTKASAKKETEAKAPAKNPAIKKASEAKATAKKPAAKKATDAKAPAKKPATKKTTGTKAIVKKPAAKKPAAKKAEATEVQAAPVKRGRRRVADVQEQQ